MRVLGLRLRVGHSLPVWLIGGATLLIAAVLGLRGAESSARAQPGNPPCIGMPPLAELTVEVALGRLAVTAATEDVTLAGGPVRRGLLVNWDVQQQATGAAERVRCISVAMHGPGGDYESQAVATLPPGAREFRHTPLGVAGEYCFRFVMLTQTSRSEFTEVCQEFAAQGPIPPDTNPEPAPGAPNAGTGLLRGGQPERLAAVLALAGAAAAVAGFGPALLRLARR
jgi:hypothetical protein